MQEKQEGTRQRYARKVAREKAINYARKVERNQSRELAEKLAGTRREYERKVARN